jgi:hypothetical protein
MTDRLIRDLDDLVEAIRARRDELNISHETIDHLAGLQSGYAGKLLAPVPIRRLGPMSLAAVLGALGVGLIMVEDVEAVERVRGRWKKRRRVQRKAPAPKPA